MELSTSVHDCAKWVCESEDTNVGKRFTAVHILGRGSGAEVVLVKSTASRAVYACKAMKKRSSTGRLPLPLLPRNEDNTEARDMFQYTTSPESEARLHSGLRHPNIVPVHEVCETPEWIYVVMQASTHGSLIDMLLTTYPSGIPEPLLLPIFLDICSGIRYLHAAGVAHRDVKPDNILLFRGSKGSRGWKAKLCDFGAARSIDQVVNLSADSDRMDDRPLYDYAGTVQYSAPEVLTGEGHGLKADSWSLGVTLYVLLCGHMPFFGKDYEEQIHRTCTASYGFPARLFGETSRSAIHLINSLLVVEPDDRYSISDVIQHPWVAGAC